MRPDDVKLRNRLVRGKTSPGSREAREQYKQLRFLVTAQWVFVAVTAGIAVKYSLSWVALAVLVGSCVLGIPVWRKFLRVLRENAYRQGPPDK
jgi:hypothetical protein